MKHSECLAHALHVHPQLQLTEDLEKAREDARNLDEVKTFTFLFLFIYLLIPSLPHHHPSEHFPLWEIPINELDRREDPTYDEVGLKQ